MRESRIMYIEAKSEGDFGTARIGRVSYSKSGKSIIYDGRTFQSLKGKGIKSNYYDVDTGEEFWISGCKKNGEDRLYNEGMPVSIDEDAREEYWEEIRRLPDKKNESFA